MIPCGIISAFPARAAFPPHGIDYNERFSRSRTGAGPDWWERSRQLVGRAVDDGTHILVSGMRRGRQVSPLESADRAVCRRCGAEKVLHSEATDHSQLELAPGASPGICTRRRIFPRALGLMIVIVQFAISTVFWYYEMPIATYSVLIASALIDWALYPRVPDVTICYRCSCQVRGEGSNPDERFRPFDLAIGERYRQERIRAQQLRERGV